MEENPYRAPPADTVEADAPREASRRRVASLSAGFCLSLGVVLGMTAAVCALVVGLSDGSWLGWTPVVALGSTVNAVTSMATGWSIWKARWRAAAVIFVSGLAAFVLMALCWYAIFGD